MKKYPVRPAPVMSIAQDLQSLQKAIKGATKPKEAPPKEKYLATIRQQLAQDSTASEPAFAQLSQLLLPRLGSSSLIVSLKAHLVVHQLVTDTALNKYAFFNFISRYYAAQQRSSVNGMIGAHLSEMLAPQLPPPSPSASTESFGEVHSHSTTSLGGETRPRKASNAIGFLNFRKASTSSIQESILEDLSTKKKQPFFPNLAHTIPQSAEVNRLISAYNRYLRERVLHYRQLKIDPICEKVAGTSIVDNGYLASKSLSETLLSQLQCVIQQIRLLLACIFPPVLLKQPLYAYCYGVVAKDLSLLFQFLNAALVIALQQFFTLSRAHAETTLFIYKEYTQLQIGEEVLAFLNQAPNSVNETDLHIPQELLQDSNSVRDLTKSLENYLFRIINAEKTALLSKKMSESDISDFQYERKSLSSVSSVSTISSPVNLLSAKDVTSRVITPLNISNVEGRNLERVRARYNDMGTGIPRVKSSDSDRSHLRPTVNRSPFDPIFGKDEHATLPTGPLSTKYSRFFNDLASNVAPLLNSDTREGENLSRENNLSYSTTHSLEKFQVPPRSVLRKPSIASANGNGPREQPGGLMLNNYSCPHLPINMAHPSLPDLTEIFKDSPPPLPPIAKSRSLKTGSAMSRSTPDVNFTRLGDYSVASTSIDIDDPSMENWKGLFDSLNKQDDDVFSLNFNVADAVQQTMNTHEDNMSQNQQPNQQIKTLSKKFRKRSLPLLNTKYSSSRSSATSKNAQPPSVPQSTKAQSSPNLPVQSDKNNESEQSLRVPQLPSNRISDGSHYSDFISVERVDSSAGNPVSFRYSNYNPYASEDYHSQPIPPIPWVE